MEIKVISKPVDAQELEIIAARQFGDMVKAVVDIEREVVAIAGELHADEEALLLEQGSDQENLWGINLYIGSAVEDWIEFDSLINIRPSQGNISRDVGDLAVREKIVRIVDKLINK